MKVMKMMKYHLDWFIKMSILTKMTSCYGGLKDEDQTQEKTGLEPDVLVGQEGVGSNPGLLPCLLPW